MLAVLAVVVLRLMTDRHPAISGFEFWMPWLEKQSWAPMQRLVAAALLVAGGFVTFRVAARLSFAPWVALALTLVTVWVFPVRGSAAGFLLCALILWAGNRYVDGPGREGFWLLTVLTIVVSALRIDFGVYVAVASLAALFVRHVRDGAQVFGRAALGYVGALAVVMLVFIPLGQVHASAYGLSSRVTEVVARGFRMPERMFHIRWAVGVDPAERQAKEREHTLNDGQEISEDPTGRTWRYRWNHLPPLSILRLLNDPAVEDTEGFDRTSARYLGTSGSSDADLEWVSRLPLGATGAAFKVVALLPWLWVVLPIAAAIRVSRGATRLVTAHLESRADMIGLPAIALCLPIARLVLQDRGDIGPVAAPAMAALAVVAAWLITAPRQSSVQAASAPEWLAATRAPATAHERAYDINICVGLSVLTVLLHLYVNTDFTNDHAGYLSMSRQIVYGYWPIRDFRDDGALLQILLSALVQKIGGFRLLGEMLLSWAFFAAANCLTYWLTFRLTGKRIAAVVAAVFATLLLPRPVLLSQALHLSARDAGPLALRGAATTRSPGRCRGDHRARLPVSHRSRRRHRRNEPGLGGCGQWA